MLGHILTTASLVRGVQEWIVEELSLESVVNLALTDAFCDSAAFPTEPSLASRQTEPDSLISSACLIHRPRHRQQSALQQVLRASYHRAHHNFRNATEPAEVDLFIEFDDGVVQWMVERDVQDMAADYLGESREPHIVIQRR
jgi:hypothetical protein